MHKCVRCGRIFEKITEEMLRGCPECGSNLFFYIREQKTADFVDKIKVEGGVKEEEKIESIRILSPGVYELNLDALLEREEIIMAIKEEGSYVVHLPSLFVKKKKSTTTR
ncbi:MAG: Zn-ribbon domain-containing protein [Candidatus Methanospirareceae archaeon]